MKKFRPFRNNKVFYRAQVVELVDDVHGSTSVLKGRSPRRTDAGSTSVLKGRSPRRTDVHEHKCRGRRTRRSDHA